MLNIENPMARPLSRDEEIRLWGDKKAEIQAYEAARGDVFDNLTCSPDMVFREEEIAEYDGEDEALGRLVMLAVDDLRQHEERGDYDRRERDAQIINAARKLAELLVENRMPIAMQRYR